MENVLNATKNNFVCVGTLSELKLEYKKDDKTKIGKGDDRHEVSSESITGSFTVDIGGEVVTFFARWYSVGYDGNEAKTWKPALDLLKANPKIGGSGEEPTRVKVSGQIGFYDKWDTERKVMNSRITYNPQFVTCNPKDEDDGMTVETEAFVRKIANEIKDDEETGRKIVSLYGINYDGSIYPIDAIADSEIDEDNGVSMADVVEDGFENYESLEAGQTRTGVILEVRMRHEGAKTVKRKTFGRKNNVNTTSGGKTIQELFIVGFDPVPVDEPEEDDDNENSRWIDPANIKKAVKEREKHLEELKNAPAEKKEAKTAKKTTVTVARKPVEDDSEEDPF